MIARFIHAVASCLGYLFLMLAVAAVIIIYVDGIMSKQRRNYYGNLVEVEYFERPLTTQEADYEKRIFDSVLTTLKAWNENEINHPKIPQNLLPFLAVQTVHETDFLRSAICRENNNWFGMKKPSMRARTISSENRGHASYPNVSESIRDMVYYLNTVRILTDGRIKSIESYCRQLQRNKYAQDPNYCVKICNLYNRLVKSR